jgi:hypothetical protein
MARLACPRHPGSRVHFDGTYGSPGRKRQRHKCFPQDGRPRVFTEPLPRQRSSSGECDHCERGLAVHEGLPSPRFCFFSAREIAATLVRVGEGMSYRAAGRYVRQLAGRMRPAAGTIPEHPSRDGSLVEDSVEVFAPALFSERRPTEWPDVVILDDLPFRIRSTAA